MDAGIFCVTGGDTDWSHYNSVSETFRQYVLNNNVKHIETWNVRKYHKSIRKAIRKMPVEPKLAS